MVKIDYNNIKSGRTVGSKKINIIDNRIYVEKDGLNHSDVEENRKKYGDNRLTKKKRLSFAKQLLTNLNDPIIKILIGALIINAIVSLGKINIP